jgi:hypothetical protein
MTTTTSGQAASDLGLGGAGLSQQVKDETDDERRRRLALAQQKLALGPAAQSLGLGGYG